VAKNREILGDTAHATIATVRDFGAMLLPFTNKERGAARINASLRSFAKPGTWFAPMWAIMVGVVASPYSRFDLATIARTLLLMFMAGPLLCAFSQIVNDHFDRDVDRINEPLRPTAADLLGGRTIAIVAAILAVLSIGIAFALGRTVGFLAIGGLLLALAYSAPPLRLKAHNGWIANAACAFSYEGFAWLAGTAAFGVLTNGDLILASLFSLGAHGLMTLNDFKSIKGDRELGLRSIPVMLGEKRALLVALWFVNIFQAAALAYVLAQRYWIAAAIMNLLLVVQLPMQARLARDPAKNAPWYCASGIPLFCWSMLAAAIALRLGRF
jgi:chlorophyll/bacteriochlorophyll a synthase